MFATHSPMNRYTQPRLRPICRGSSARGIKRHNSQSKMAANLAYAVALAHKLTNENKQTDCTGCGEQQHLAV